MSNTDTIFKLKENFMTFYEKHGSVKNYEEAFAKCDQELAKNDFILLNRQNYLLVNDLMIRIYASKSSVDNIILFIIYSPVTHSMFFPINIERNCPAELISLAQNILDKTIYKR